MNILDPSLTERTAFTGTERFYVGINEATPDYYVEHGTLLSNVALLDAANTFTAAQTISTSSAVGLTVERPSNNAQMGLSDGTNTFYFLMRNGGTQCAFNATQPNYRFGIGNTTPGAKLHVVNGDASYPAVKIEAGTTASVGLIVDAASGATASNQEWHYNGILYGYWLTFATANKFVINSADLGNDIMGPSLFIGRNSTAGAAGPAAGTIRFYTSGATRYVWLDTSFQMRYSAQAPTGSSGSESVKDDSGNLIGTQTSNERYKNLLGAGATADEALGHIRDAVGTIQRFTYREGEYGGQEFDGIVIRNGDGLQRYGMDADEEHDGGKSLNEVNAIADLMRVVTMQAEQIEALQDRISELEKTI